MKPTDHHRKKGAEKGFYMKTNKKIPVLGFSAYSGVGKTTLIEQLLPCLKSYGIRTAVFKHDVHGFEIDHEGKDSWRFSRAGADISVICSSKKLAYIEQREHSFEEALSQIHDVDLILVEGYKEKRITRVGICRKSTGKGFPDALERYAAVVTDRTDLRAKISVYRLDDIEEICGFIVENMGNFTYMDENGRLVIK